MCTFTVGWQGITKQLLSDKLNQGNRKQDVQKKKKPLRHTGHALNQLFVLGLLGKRIKKSRTDSWAKLWSTLWVRSTIPTVWGYPDLGVGWGRSVTHIMEIDLLEIHHHGNRDLGQEFWIYSGKAPIHGIGLADKWLLGMPTRLI